jgi:hypothetical protein
LHYTPNEQTVRDVSQERYNNQISTAQEVLGVTPRCHLHQLKGIEKKNNGLEILHFGGDKNSTLAYDWFLYDVR